MLVYIGGVLIGNLDTGIPLITYESPYYKMNLSSEDTFPMRGYRDVIVVLDGTDGVRQVIIAGILFERLPTDYQTPTTNDGVNMIIELDVSTSPVTGSAELIDALKGDKGDPGYGVLPMDGAPGQVVTKLSYTEQDAGWRTPIQLGETSADSYRGDRGKIAYDHSQTTHAPADAEKNVNADWNSVSGDSQILNKPTIPSIAGLATTTYVDQQDSLKVDKVAGKQLSTNDYTVAEKDKLSGIEAGAQVNIIESVKVNSTVLPIASKSVDITVPTQPSDIGAEPLLPSTPTNPESRFLNGNKQWAEIVLGSGGYASNVYFTNLTSTIVGSYKQTSGTHELTETIASGTCNNNEVLIHTYLFEQPVGITTVDAGVWRFTMNSKINSSVGDSKFKIVQFKRSSTGVETDMFTIYSNTIENTDYQNFIIETVQPSFLVDSLDRFGCRIYATTTTTVNKTISYKVGDGFASYLNTPLALRHPQLRDPNGNSNVQHLTAAQVTKVNNTSGINTGDETLTSIKTKLGAASAVSDGYLKYQDFALLHTPTTVTASNGLSISGQNISLQNASLTQSGALTFNDWNTFNSKEPAFSKNTAFNKNFGTTTGTVLEGRTFGTAANSSTGDFIQNQNSSAQSANMWINGIGKFGGSLIGINGVSGIPLTVQSGSGANAIKIIGRADNLSYLEFYKNDGVTLIGDMYGANDGLHFDGSAAFSSTVNSTGFLLNGNNLTSSLLTNYLPKWNGSSFVNSLISDDGTSMTLNGYITGNTGIRLNRSEYNTFQMAIDDTGLFMYDVTRGQYLITFKGDDGRGYIPSTTSSTSPTTGALVVGGGIGADHVRANNFYGNGSNLTGVQKPITLTTNGTSGAATFENGVMNVPNYTNNAGGGSYSPSISVGSNTANPVVYSALYTKNGTVYSSIIKGYIECTGSQGNTCTFNVSTYNGSTSNLSIIGVGAQGTNMILGSGSTGSNVVVSFTNPVGSGGIGFTLIVHYTN